MKRSLQKQVLPPERVGIHMVEKPKKIGKTPTSKPTNLPVNEEPSTGREGREFVIPHFIGLEMAGKIKYFAERSSIRIETLADILEVNTVRLSEYWDRRSVSYVDAAELRQALEEFAPLMAYLLKVGQHNGELISQLWSGKANYFYDGAKNPPPWAESGLETFLLGKRRQGLCEAVAWIREYSGASPTIQSSR